MCASAGEGVSVYTLTAMAANARIGLARRSPNVLKKFFVIASPQVSIISQGLTLSNSSDSLAKIPMDHAISLSRSNSDAKKCTNAGPGAFLCGYCAIDTEHPKRALKSECRPVLLKSKGFLCVTVIQAFSK